MGSESFGFWTDESIYLKRSNLFSVQFDFDLAALTLVGATDEITEAFEKHKKIVDRINGIPIFLKSVQNSKYERYHNCPCCSKFCMRQV